MSRLYENIEFSLNNRNESERNRTQILNALSWLKERTVTSVINKMIATDSEIRMAHKDMMTKMRAELQREEEKLKAIPIPVRMQEEFEMPRYDGILGASALPKQREARSNFEKNQKMNEAKYKTEKRRIDIANRKAMSRIEQIKKAIARNEDFRTFVKDFMINDSARKEAKESELLNEVFLIYGEYNDHLPDSIWPTRHVNSQHSPGKRIVILDKKEKVDRFLSLAYADSDAVAQVVKYNETVDKIGKIGTSLKTQTANLLRLREMEGILKSTEFDLLMDRMKRMNEFSEIIVENAKIKNLARGNIASKLKGETYSLMHAKAADDREVRKANAHLDEEVERHDKLLRENPKYRAAFKAYTMIALRGEYGKQDEVKGQFTKKCNALKKAGIVNDVVAYAFFEQKVRTETMNPNMLKSFETEREFRYNTCMEEVASLTERKEKLEKSLAHQRKAFSPNANQYFSEYTAEELRKSKELLIDWKSDEKKASQRIKFSPVGSILTVDLLNEMRGRDSEGLLSLLKDFEKLSKKYDIEAIKNTIFAKVDEARKKAKESSKSRVEEIRTPRLER